mgnify:CR=1 FL=1
MGGFLAVLVLDDERIVLAAADRVVRARALPAEAVIGVLVPGVAAAGVEVLLGQFPKLGAQEREGFEVEHQLDTQEAVLLGVPSGQALGEGVVTFRQAARGVRFAGLVFGGQGREAFLEFVFALARRLHEFRLSQHVVDNAFDGDAQGFA